MSFEVLRKRRFGSRNRLTVPILTVGRRFIYVNSPALALAGWPLTPTRVEVLIDVEAKAVAIRTVSEAAIEGRQMSLRKGGGMVVFAGGLHERLGLDGVAVRWPATLEDGLLVARQPL